MKGRLRMVKHVLLFSIVLLVTLIAAETIVFDYIPLMTAVIAPPSLLIGIFWYIVTYIVPGRPWRRAAVGASCSFASIYILLLWYRYKTRASVFVSGEWTFVEGVPSSMRGLLTPMADALLLFACYLIAFLMTDLWSRLSK